MNLLKLFVLNVDNKENSYPYLSLLASSVFRPTLNSLSFHSFNEYVSLHRYHHYSLVSTVLSSSSVTVSSFDLSMDIIIYGFICASNFISGNKS